MNQSPPVDPQSHREIVERATLATRPSSQSRSGKFPSSGSQRNRVSSHISTGFAVPLWFNCPDRSDVKAFSTVRGWDGFEGIAGVHLAIREEVSMSSSSLMQGLLIAENAG